jgi:hypothetical protein
MSKIALERLGGGTQHPRETQMKSLIFTSATGEIVLDCDGCSTLALELRGTFNATFVVEGTVDGGNYTTVVPLRPVNQASTLWVTSIAGTTQGLWVGKVAHFLKVRVRSTAYSSGPCSVTVIAANGAFDDALLAGQTTAVVTTQSAPGAAATLTLPSPGAGLRHYLTYVAMAAFAAAATTASATPANVTTTNLPGALAFTHANDAKAVGQMAAIREDFAYALAASAQNTATTLAAPAIPGILWRLTAGYFVAP